MTTTSGPTRQLWWTPRRSRWLLVATHVPLLVSSPLYTILGFQGRPALDVWVVIPLGVAIGALQLRHSFAAARGERPGGWPWTLVALAVLVYTPMWWLTWNWAAMQYFFIASAAMHLRGRAAAIVVAAPILVTTFAALPAGEFETGVTWGAVLFFFFWLGNLSVLPAILYGAARLVRALDELYAARLELAEAAAGRERSRVTRDLHDLLGQSLTAVSLKGDLALALLPTDIPAAEAEIRSLTSIARDALHDTRAVTQGQHTVSLRGEAERAAHLLNAASVDARIDISVNGLSTPVEQTLAWTIREGVTNLLRHSHARRCSITATRHGRNVHLEIVNDGAGPATGNKTGNGLAGVTERARALFGSASAERVGGGRFVLRVEIPDVNVEASDMTT
jgi:two-component system sensor histidine kinase DesK